MMIIITIIGVIWHCCVMVGYVFIRTFVCTYVALEGFYVAVKTSC